LSTRKNAMYNVAYRVFSILLPLVTAPYLSRVVGDYGVGLYSYAWSASYLFTLIGMLGLSEYGVRAIARAKDDRAELDRTFSEIWRMQLVVAGATLLVWLGYVAFVAGEEQPIALHFTLMSVSCLINFDWCLMGLGEFKPIALRFTVVKLVGAATVFLLVKGPEDLWLYALIWSVTTIIGCIACFGSLRGKVRLVKVSWKASLKHLPPCAMLFISVIAVNVYHTMDKMMVGAISGMAENGLYENAEKIIYCLTGFISAIGTVMLPKVSHMQQLGQTDRIRKHIGTSMELILCMVSALAFGIAAIAEDFAPLFYGEEFTRSGPMMIPLSFTLIFIGFADVIRTQWILPHSRDKIYVMSVSAGAVVNLIANGLLIPRFGAMGAVAGTLLAEATVPVVQWLYLRRDLPYGSYLKQVAAYAVLGAVMFAAVRLTGTLVSGGWLRIVVQIASGVAVYGALCLLWWKITRRTELMKILKRK